jgi:nitroimidazol reductase NimA-like FMN-containing flavoprotein (pyridoxamine 5'-phosphate oxidase superfamily)
MRQLKSTTPISHTDIASMETDKKFRLRLGKLFRSQNLAALSTHHAGQPYASLVAFYASDDLKHIYFVTAKTTRKFANLSANNRVAVMVNSSTNQISDFHQAISVTAVGQAKEVAGADKEPILSQYLAKHPHLEDFVGSPTCALVRVVVASYYMVRNFQNVMELHLKP